MTGATRSIALKSLVRKASLFPGEKRPFIGVKGMTKLVNYHRLNSAAWA